jgi:putative SOS response-associated peptidase YedK
VVKPIHDRMPVILDPASYANWLDPSPREGSAVLQSARQLPEELFESYTVSPMVNRAGVEDPRCVEPATASTLF